VNQTNEELGLWLAAHVTATSITAAINSPGGWHPTTDEYHARVLLYAMEESGWKAKIEPTSGCDWQVSFRKWDSRGSRGGMGRCYGGTFCEAVCYAAKFAIESLMAVEAAYA